MIQLTLKDGSIRELEAPTAAAEVIKGIGMGLYKAACCVKLDGEVCDLRTVIDHDCTFEVMTFDSEEGKKTFWHTASHVLAQAVKHLYPEAKLAIGPAIDTGFYYDFDVEHPFSQEELTKIEAEMKKIVKANEKLEQFYLSPEEAVAKLKEMDEPYKVELCEEHAGNGEPISFYQQGDFTDLCAGPHLMATGTIKAFKLLSCTGAYWRGSEKNKMLSRVYAVAFPKASMLEEHLAKQPEVKKVSITFGSTPLRYYLASTSVGPKPNFANVLVELTDSKYTKEYEEDFDAYMKANYPNAITRTSLFKLSPAVDAAIEIGFIGPNVDTLVALTNQALEIMHRNPDLINVRNSWGNKVPVWKPVYSPERAQPLGVSRQGMAQSIQIGTTGMTLGEYRQGDQVLPILLKDNTVDSFRINDLRTLPVFGTGNETTSLEQVVSEFDFQYRFSNVKDYNRQMVMMAQCDPRRGVNAIAAFNEVWPLVQKEIKVPEGYTMKYFGEQESQVESNEALAKNLPLTFFLMFVTLLFLFRTYRKPTVILLMLPLIFIGIVLGLVLLGKSFDFFSILGLLGLIGMNIKNAIVLVEQIDLEAKTGKKPLDAVVSATTSRIVPVAMASGTTILGMLPLLFDAMFGGMAATIMGGLLVASALTLFVLPVAYCAIQRIKG